MTHFNQTTISEELMITNYLDGIKLIQPQLSNKRSVKSIFNLPINAFFLLPDSGMHKLNETCLQSMGFASAKDSLGKTMLDISPTDNAEMVLSTDRAVAHTEKRYIVKNTIKLHNEQPDQTFLSIKMPWYSDTSKFQGIFGVSILLDHPLFAETLTRFSELGWLTSTPQPLHNDLSKRENELIPFLKHGQSAKYIARHLNLSTRTIESYIANIKDKFQVYSKAELIDKINKREFLHQGH